MSENKLIVILGPTAVGKTTFAAHLANKINGEIISADSRQVYRGMDIGTGKDIDDYKVNNNFINYHLIDIVDAGYKYNVFEFQQDFMSAYDDIKKRDKKAILCGGTGMYIEAILSGYKLLHVPSNKELRDELEKKGMSELVEILKKLRKTHNNSDFDSKKRIIRAIEIEKFNKTNTINYTKLPKFSHTILGLNTDREIVKTKITNRLKYRLEHGMVQEVEALIQKGISKEDIEYYGLEYKYISKYIFKELSFDEMFEKLNIAIHQFSKRQMTWFRRMEKNGFHINWLEAKTTLAENIDKSLKIVHQCGNL